MPKYMVVIKVIEEFPYSIVASDEQTAREIADTLFAQDGAVQRDYIEVSCREVK